MEVTGQAAGWVARAAADLIEKYGWVQSSYGNADRGYCMVGAMRAVANPTRHMYSTSLSNHNWYSDVLGRWIKPYVTSSPAHFCGGCAGEITVFNDTPGRTKEEVVLHLRKFADEMDPQ